MPRYSNRYVSDRYPYTGFTGSGEKYSNVIRRGTDNSRSKLTDDKVRSIRERLANGAKRDELAAEYGVCTDTIKAVGEKRTWRHVK
jgi:hypothetical protein